MQQIGPRFGVAWPLLNGLFMRLLVVWRRAFDGDIEKAIIFAAVIDKAAARPGFSSLDYAAFLSNGHEHAAAPATTVQAIAEATGIPRETVRRKVNDLIARGVLARDGDGALRLSPDGLDGLDPTMRETAIAVERAIDDLGAALGRS